MSFGPSIIDAILGLVALEFVALSVWLSRKGEARLIPALASFLLSGALLLAALRFSLDGAPVGPVTLGLLGLSFPAHLATLILVWRQVSR